MKSKHHKPKIAHTYIKIVTENLESDTPKYEDKAIKVALLSCASHWARYRDWSLFDVLIMKLPQGTWRYRALDFKEYVISMKPEIVKKRFDEIRKELKRLSNIAGYNGRS